MTTLTFNGKSFKLEHLVKSSKSFPRIEVKRDEFSSSLEQIAVSEREGPVAEPSEPVCLYKHEGSWVVLSGHEKIKQFVESDAKILKALLVSKQALKHLVTIAVPTHVVNREAERVEASMRPADQYDNNYSRSGYQNQDRNNFTRHPRRY